MSGYGTDTVCAREAAWLAGGAGMVKASVGDASGAFDVVQAYTGREQSGKRGVYVTRTSTDILKWTTFRSMPRHSMLVKVRWPMLAPGGNAEADQAALDAALELLTAQIAGPSTDKTHGGQFQFAAVSELAGSPQVTVRLADAETAVAQRQPLRATFAYLIDDHEVSA